MTSDAAEETCGRIGGANWALPLDATSSKYTAKRATMMGGRPGLTLSPLYTHSSAPSASAFRARYSLDVHSPFFASRRIYPLCMASCRPARRSPRQSRSAADLNFTDIVLNMSLTMTELKTRLSARHSANAVAPADLGIKLPSLALQVSTRPYAPNDFLAHFPS